MVNECERMKKKALVRRENNKTGIKKTKNNLLSQISYFYKIFFSGVQLSLKIADVLNIKLISPTFMKSVHKCI